MNQTIRRFHSRLAWRWSLACLGIVVVAGCGQPQGTGNPEPTSTGSPGEASPTSISGTGVRAGDSIPFDGVALRAQIRSGTGTIQRGEGQSGPLSTGQAVGAGSRVTTRPGATVDLINPALGLACRVMPDSELTVSGLSIVEPEQAISQGTHINTQLELSKGSIVVVAPELTADSTLQVWTSSLAVTGWKNALFRVGADGLVSVHPESGSVSAVTVALPVREFPDVPPGTALNPENGSIVPESPTAAADWTGAADLLRSELSQAGG